MEGPRGWRHWGVHAGFALAACSSPAPSVEGGSDGAGLGPAVEEGAPCQQPLGCGAGLYCDEGACEACGTGTPAPGKLCFEDRALVSDRPGSLAVAHLQQADGVLADNHEVHVRMLFRDGEGSLREQYFGTSDERSTGTLIDLDGDGFDDFLYCTRAGFAQCTASRFEDDLLAPFARLSRPSGGIDGVPAHGRFPARLLGRNGQREEWCSWLVFPQGVVGGSPLPVYPSGRALAADLDGDDTYEVVAPIEDELVVLELDPAGVEYTVRGAAPVPVDSELVAAVDLDGDGRDELLVGAPQNALIVFGDDSAGDLVASDPLALTLQPTSLAIGDLDGDGRIDLATKDQTFPAPESETPAFDRILVLAQTEPGAFVRRYVPFPRVGSVAIFDVDRDGHMDLVVSSPDGIHQMLADP